MKGSLLTLTHTSRALKGNPLGDPHVRELPVYLPPSYDGKKRFPVVWAQTGYTGKGVMLQNIAAWGETLVERIERLKLEMIFALPDCFTKYGGSQYVNSAGTGRYEDYFIDELVPFVDANFRTIPRADARAVFGKSSGGFGSLIYGMRHPDVFGLIACHSGDLYYEYCYQIEIPKYLNGLRKYGGSTAALIKAFFKAPNKTTELVHMILMVGIASCYSPNPRSPLGFDMPFDEGTGRMRPDVWKRWLEWDPLRMLPRYAGNLRKLRLLYMDCGFRDEYQLHFGARIFVEELKKRKIKHVYEEFDDGHGNIAYRYDRSLPLIARKIARS